MMQAYSMDLRKRVLSDCDAGLKTKAVATKYQVSESWVRRLKQRRRETGEIAPRQRSAYRRPIIDRAKLAELIQQKPDYTLAELRDRLGVKCSLVAIWLAIKQLKITYKKRRSAPASKNAPMSPKNGRNGGRSKSASIRRNSSLSTKRGRKRI